VISVDVLKIDGALRYGADIALDDGQLLIDGPTGTVAVTEDLTALRREIETAIGKVARLLTAVKPCSRKRSFVERDAGGGLAPVA